MKVTLYVLLTLLSNLVVAQHDLQKAINKDSVDKLKRWNSNLDEQVAQALTLTKREIIRDQRHDSSVFGYRILFVGPRLWERYKAIDTMTKITKDEVYTYDTGTQRTQLIHSSPDFKLFWHQLKKEIGKNYKVSIATFKEKKYYIRQLSFHLSVWDPVIIITSQKQKFILKFIGPKHVDKLRLHWIEEVPVSDMPSLTKY